jgi:hypothetical protein
MRRSYKQVKISHLQSNTLLPLACYYRDHRYRIDTLCHVLYSTSLYPFVAATAVGLLDVVYYDGDEGSVLSMSY